jgi:histone deacetylase complex regulatory component SIN3
MGVDITPSPRSIDIRVAESPLELSSALACSNPLDIPASAAAGTPLELSSSAASLTPLLNYERASEALALVQRTTGEKPPKIDKPLTKPQQKLFGEALSFIDRLRKTLGNGEAYEEFLKILNEFKEGK